MPLGLYLLPAVRTGSSNTRGFFWWSLAPDLHSVKTILAGNLRSFGVENYWRFSGIKTPSMKARTKMLATFEAGVNSPNLPWHVNITSLKKKKPIRGSPLLSPS